MLRPHTAYSAYGVKKYFETADYYSQGNETVGLWGGKLARQWGLTGQVPKGTMLADKTAAVVTGITINEVER